jgi:hypothetical protein
MDSRHSCRRNTHVQAAAEAEKRMKTTIAVVICAAALSGCSDMSARQQRAVSGTAIGAAGGAVLGAIGGNAGLGAAAGAAAGLAGGLIYDHVKENENAAYQQGYSAGRSTH